jgi:hypothetical protein
LQRGITRLPKSFIQISQHKAFARSERQQIDTVIPRFARQTMDEVHQYRTYNLQSDSVIGISVPVTVAVAVLDNLLHMMAAPRLLTLLTESYRRFCNLQTAFSLRISKPVGLHTQTCRHLHICQQIIADMQHILQAEAPALRGVFE